MRISEVIKMLEKAKKEHGDIQVVQFCSKEGLLMPIRGYWLSRLIREHDGGRALVLDDNEEFYFHKLPPVKGSD